MTEGALRTLLLLAICLFPPLASAIPRFGARKGLPCQACHVDPSGGGMRNDFGRNVFASTELAFPAASLPEDAAPLDARLTDSVAMGADLRLLYQHLRKRDADQPRMDSFYLMEATTYLSAKLWKYATLYIAPSLHGSETVSFEAFGMVQLPAAGFYLKIGRFTAPYGYKLPNHTAFIRKKLGFNIRSKEVGVEIGMSPGPFSIQVAVFNGISDGSDGDWDDNPQKGVSARLSYLLNTRRLKMEAGLSGYWNLTGLDADSSPAGKESRIEDLKAGAFGSLSVGRFTWLGEVDYWRRDDRSQPEALGQLFSYQELTFMPVRGLDLSLTYELWDQNVEVSGDAAHRLGAVLDLFAWPFTELEIGMRVIVADEAHKLNGIREMFIVGHFFF